MPGGAVFGFDTAAARRYVELINKIMGMESGDAPLPPGFLLEIDRPEWAFLKRELYWTTGDVLIAGAVGNVSRLQIQNPPSSNRIVVVEGFVVLNSAASLIYEVTRDGALAGTPTANLALDTRVTPVTASRKVSSLNRIDNALPGVSGEKMDGRTSSVGGGANQDLFFNFRVGPCRPIILVPNTVCEVVCTIANTQLRAFGFGYEHPITPDELAL